MLSKLSFSILLHHTSIFCFFRPLLLHCLYPVFTLPQRKVRPKRENTFFAVGALKQQHHLSKFLPLPINFKFGIQWKWQIHWKQKHFCKVILKDAFKNRGRSCECCRNSYLFTSGKHLVGAQEGQMNYKNLQEFKFVSPFPEPPLSPASLAPP